MSTGSSNTLSLNVGTLGTVEKSQAVAVAGVLAVMN